MDPSQAKFEVGMSVMISRSDGKCVDSNYCIVSPTVVLANISKLGRSLLHFRSHNKGIEKQIVQLLPFSV